MRQKKLQAVECHWIDRLMDQLDWSESDINIGTSAKLTRAAHVKFEKNTRQPVALDDTVHRTL